MFTMCFGGLTLGAILQARTCWLRSEEEAASAVFLLQEECATAVSIKHAC